MYKRGKRKGQAALEFLYNYGWALFVVTLVIGALVYMQTLRPEQLLPERCVITKGSGLSCYDYSINKDPVFGSRITLMLENKMDNYVNVTRINLESKQVECTEWNYHVGIRVPWRGKENFQIDCDNLGVGERFTADIEIDFRKADGTPKTTTGRIEATVGEISPY
jgi:hypothetical protein